MGSYRRGKQKCGDVDILITHPDYMDFVPPRALGKVVDELLQERHMAHHLTFISGMEQENTNESGGNSKQKKDKYSGSSYMGVFHSPCVTGRYRRVDIKFYPYRERIFASLYFTGNGHFNRSMRLWAMRKFNYSMNDHGLFLLNTKERVMESNSEKEVFDRLDMLWKEPHERDCFDAVISKRNGETAAQLEEMSNHELNSEGQEHSWIN
jgi:DNA polymerase lambda